MSDTSLSTDVLMRSVSVPSTTSRPPSCDVWLSASSRARSTGSLIVHPKPPSSPEVHDVASNTESSKRTSTWKATKRPASSTLARISSASGSPGNDCAYCSPLVRPRSTSPTFGWRFAAKRTESCTSGLSQAKRARTSTSSQWLPSSVKPPVGSERTTSSTELLNATRTVAS